VYKGMDLNALIQGSRFIKQKNYWLKKLPSVLAKTAIAPDGGQLPGGKQEKLQVEIPLPDQVCEKLHKFGKGANLSIFITLLTVLKTLIYRYSFLEDITVITPVYKNKISSETINSCLFICDGIQPEMSFKELLLRVKMSVLDAHENQDYPFAKIFEHVFETDSEQSDIEISDLFCALNNIHADVKINQIDVKLSFIFERQDKNIMGQILFDPNRYGDEFMQGLALHFGKILEYSLENPDAGISQIPLLSMREIETLIYDLNDNKAEYSKNKTICQLTEDLAALQPERIAIEERGIQLSYRELNNKVNQLAGLLQKYAIQQDQLLAILLDRSLEMVISILATWKVGAAYLPLDTKSPVKRITGILEDSGTIVLLTRSEFVTQKLREDFKNDIFMLDTASPQLSQSGTENLDIIINMHSLSYVIYTSGSTGKPKGAMVEHIGMMNHIQSKVNELQVTDSSIIAQNASHTFDISIWQFFTALVKGGKTIIYSNQLVLDPSAFITQVTNDEVTILEVVPSYLVVMFDVMTADFKAFPSLVYLLVTGETLKAELVRRWFEKYPGIKMVNAYGPTEASDDITHHVMDKAPDYDWIPIGKPVQNLHIYIVDAHMNLCPVGVKGEICVSGVGVGRGYLKDEIKTAEVFSEDPFQEKGIRFYKTGDVGRWTRNGTIEFFGRKDYQVKIRGYRIELGEIESKLVDHPSVKEAVVIDKEDKKGNKFLCAYLLPDGNIDLTQIKKYLLENLTPYMVPAHFVILETLPLTSNGKVNRRLLPDPVITSEDDYEAPRNDVERRLLLIWSEVLTAPKDTIGIHSDFFAMGGHSLKATSLVAKIHRAFDVKIPLPELFRHPTISGISEYLMQAKQEKYHAVNAVEKKEYYSLSAAQRRLYILQLMNVESTGYNMPGMTLLEGTIDIKKLKDTFHHLIARHESLRTSFEYIGKQVVQRISEAPVKFALEYYDATAETNSSNYIKGLVGAFVRPFVLSQLHLLRVALVKIAHNKHILMFDMHHIISDGISQDILVNDFMHLYSGLELPQITTHYKDYSEWRNNLSEAETADLARQGEFWQGQFKDEVPVLLLRTDYPRPQVKGFAGDRVLFGLPEGTKDALEKIALETGGTLYIVFLTIFNVLLARLSGQADIVIGSPVAGRQKVDMEGVIGMFVNTLALRNFPEQDKRVIDFLYDVKERTLAAFENQDYQFENLVDRLALERDVSRNPVFDVMFNYIKAEKDSNQRRLEKSFDLKATPYDHEILTAKFDLNLSIGVDDGLSFILEYSSNLFKPETIDKFVAYYKMIVAAIIQDQTVAIGNIAIIPEAEKRQMLYEFNSTEMQYPDRKSISQLFEDQVAKTPDSVALVSADQQISYKILNEHVNRVAANIRPKCGLGNPIVGLMVERSIEMMFGILGLLKAGAAFVPIDPSYPEDRIRYMLQDSDSKLLLTRQRWIKSFDFNAEIIDIENVAANGTSTNPASVYQVGNLIYCIYTSGSTGRPKGVMVKMQSFVNLLNWYVKEFDMGPRDNNLLIAPISFDLSQKNLFSAHIRGGRLILSPPGIPDYNNLPGLIEKEQISIINCAPSIFAPIVDSDSVTYFAKLRSLRYVMLGGEAIRTELLLRFVNSEHFNCEIVNHYGPTEGTDLSVFYRIPREVIRLRQEIPIGKPIYNIKVFILGKKNEMLPMMVAGEICVGGVPVARGYCNRPQLTGEKFVDTPHLPCDRVYRTGDLGRWMPDGNLEFLGRIDFQVKIRGVRIELEEIENLLHHHNDIKTAIVMQRQNEKHEKYLCAYVISEESISSSDLRDFLAKELPEFMIPSAFMQVDSIPLTPSGKVNRKALEKMGTQLQLGTTYVAPKDPYEKNIADIWKEVLSVEKVGIHDNYFDLGGTSFDIIYISKKLKEDFDIDIPVIELFRYTTVKALAGHLKSGKVDITSRANELGRGRQAKIKMAQRRRRVSNG
jgi:amino acid adenylation domain-containing protein